MSRNRWKEIWSIMIFHDSTQSHDEIFIKLRNLINIFNDHMTDTFNAGYILFVDEMMSMWYGLGEWHPKGMPHVAKIARKPKGMTCVADGITGIMLFLEICESKEDMSCKKFTGPHVNMSTATTLRLTEQWFGCWRIIVGNSWFASITTAIALYEHCLYFIGLVKTGYRESTKKYLSCMPLLMKEMFVQQLLYFFHHI